MKVAKCLITILYLSVAITAQVKKPDAPLVKPSFEKALQTVVVITDDWDKTTGTAALFERKSTRAVWKQIGESFPIVVGRSGLAGEGGFARPKNDAPTLGMIFVEYCNALLRKDDAKLAKIYSTQTVAEFRSEMKAENITSLSRFLEDEIPAGCFAANEVIDGDKATMEVFAASYPSGIHVNLVNEEGTWKLTNRSPTSEASVVRGIQKQEGDGNSPAGVFPLTSAFGTGAKPSGVQMPYTKLDEYTECVDDSKSTFYNRIVNRMQVGNFDWKSSEKMASIVPEYELGVFVGYNTYPVEKGRGSCIFLHVWKDAETPTAGCTAMERSNMERVLAWLSPAKNPFLVQMPRKIYDSRQKAWKLPKLN